MKYETECAASFWSSKINPSLGKNTILIFEREVLTLLCEKFALHWYDSNPLRGQAYREITCDLASGQFDPVLLTAANRAGFSLCKHFLLQSNSTGIRMWVDPGEVEIKFLNSPYPSQVIYQKGQNMTISPPSTSPRRSLSPVYYQSQPEIDYYQSLSYTEPTSIDYYNTSDVVYYTLPVDPQTSSVNEEYYPVQNNVIASV